MSPAHQHQPSKYPLENSTDYPKLDIDVSNTPYNAKNAKKTKAATKKSNTMAIIMRIRGDLVLAIHTKINLSVTTHSQKDIVRADRTQNDIIQTHTTSTREDNTGLRHLARMIPIPGWETTLQTSASGVMTSKETTSRL